MQPPIKELINALFDHIKEQEHFTSDAALARYLKTHPMNISRWRDGEVSPSTIALLPAALAFNSKMTVSTSTLETA